MPSSEKNLIDVEFEWRFKGNSPPDDLGNSQDENPDKAPYETRHIRFRLKPGITALIGPSGAGKTSLARLLCGQDLPISGQISFKGTCLFRANSHLRTKPFITAKHAWGIGYVPQNSSLFPHMTIAENLFFSLARRQKTAAKKAAGPLIADLNLTPHLNQMPHMLSGGQARKVATARALIAGQTFIILDEPFTGLDTKNQTLLKKTILKYEKTGVSFLLISHSIEHCLALAEETLLIDKGRLLCCGSSEEILDSPEILDLFGDTFGGVKLKAVLTASGLYLEGQRLFSPHMDYLLPPEGTNLPASIQIKSKDVALALAQIKDTSISNQLAVRVEDITPLGNNKLIKLTLKDTSVALKALLTPESCTRLNITKGTQGYALIKAVSIKGNPAAGSGSVHL